MIDSWINEIFYTYSSYEMKNFLIQSNYAWRVLICSKEESIENKVIYSGCTMQNDNVHMNIESALYMNELIKPNIDGSSKLFYCPKSIYKTSKEFLGDFEYNYGGVITDRYYETKYGWIMDEDNSEDSKRFCIDIMKGKKI